MRSLATLPVAGTNAEAAANLGRSTAAEHSYSRAEESSREDGARQRAEAMRRWPLSVLLSSVASLLTLDVSRPWSVRAADDIDRMALAQVVTEYAKESATLPSSEKDLARLVASVADRRVDFFAAKQCDTCGGRGIVGAPFDTNCAAAWAHRFVRPFMQSTLTIDPERNV